MSRPIPTRSLPSMTPSSSLGTSTSTTPDSSASPSSLLPTPFLENRLNSLLANCDSGTHAFCRAERHASEDDKVPWAESLFKRFKPWDPSATVLAERRPSILSLLTLSRPLSQTLPLSPNKGTAPATAAIEVEEKVMRHFDPSRDPKLLHLL